jgi:predicted GIY-YIG superfamily endonuclease
MRRKRLFINTCFESIYYLYVLALEEGKFYVGISTEPEYRYLQHKDGIGGAEYTSKYKPIAIVYKKSTGTPDKKEAEKQETDLTIELMKKYGPLNVRGGYFCSANDQIIMRQLKARSVLLENIVMAFANKEYADKYTEIDDELKTLSPLQAITLAQFFLEKGCTVVDKRPSGGCLWVAGDKNMIGTIVAEAESKYGVTGSYGRGRAIQYQIGWYTKDNA